MGHPVFLVSGVELPVDEDSLPLHIVGQEPPEREREMVRLVAERPDLTRTCGGWLASLHPEVWKEFVIMARTKGKELVFDVRPAIESLGLGRVIEQVGLDRVIEEVGPNRLIEQLGAKAVIQHIGLDRLLASLSPAERRELKRRLE